MLLWKEKKKTPMTQELLTMSMFLKNGCCHSRRNYEFYISSYSVFDCFFFFFFFSILGVRTNVVKDVIDHSPAKMAGMLSGDRIVRIENVEIRDWDNLVRNISSKTDEVLIAVNRDGKEISLNVKPELKNGKHVIGITPKIQKNFLSSFTAAFKAYFICYKRCI